MLESIRKPTWCVTMESVPIEIWCHSLTLVAKTIGRSPDRDIRLHHASVSRDHAAICIVDDVVQIQDCNSRNGVYVNNVRVSLSNVSLTDRWRVGDVSLRLVRTSPVVDDEPIAERSTGFLIPANSAEPPTVMNTFERLTATQQRVLLQLLQGMSEAEAAKSLFVSPNTIHSHVRSIFRAYGVNSRGELLSSFVDPRLVAQLIGGDITGTVVIKDPPS